MSAPTPPVIPQPFATSGDRNTIPNTTPSLQLASYAEGYPAATMQPIDAGGVPPLGQDFNGILYDITSWLFAQQGGYIPKYDSDISDAISGYGKGALVLMANEEGYWLNQTEDNTTDPDAGGAGWQAAFAYGFADISGLTGTLRTLTAPEAGKYFLVLSGTLTGNQQVVVPNTYRNWLVINNTTGAFTVTVKTSAGTGIVIPQTGAASPLAVWCDTVNVNRTFVPSALPTSVSPVADTIVLRDNTGAAFSLTPAVNDSSTAIATTAFVNPARTLSANGSQTLPSGLILKWGFNARVGSAAQTVTFPGGAFPNTVYAVIPTGVRRTAGTALGQVPTVIGTPGLSSFELAHSDGSTGANWFAIGR